MKPVLRYCNNCREGTKQIVFLKDGLEVTLGVELWVYYKVFQCTICGSLEKVWLKTKKVKHYRSGIF